VRIEGFSEPLYRKIALRLTYIAAELTETLPHTSAYNFTIRHVSYALNTDYLRSEMSGSEPLFLTSQYGILFVSVFFVKYFIDET
jgi:hypothetical protein